jgi:hypothetical protein
VDESSTGMRWRCDPSPDHTHLVCHVCSSAEVAPTLVFPMWVIIGHGVGVPDGVKERQQHSVGNLAAWLVNLDLASVSCRADPPSSEPRRSPSTRRPRRPLTRPWAARPRPVAHPASPAGGRAGQTARCEVVSRTEKHCCALTLAYRVTLPCRSSDAIALPRSVLASARCQRGAWREDDRSHGHVGDVGRKGQSALTLPLGWMDELDHPATNKRHLLPREMHREHGVEVDEDQLELRAGDLGPGVSRRDQRPVASHAHDGLERVSGERRDWAWSREIVRRRRGWCQG